MERAQASYILKDLKKKMVFLIGPRQVGKTWLAKRISEEYEKPMYLNYDRLEDRKLIKDEAWPETADLLIFDEIHKMPEWKNYVKGIYDTKPQTLHLLVTGSARLDTFRQAGDSLAGRFFRHRLFPLSYKELPDKGRFGPRCPLLSVSRPARLFNSYSWIKLHARFPQMDVWPGCRFGRTQ